MSWAAFLTPVVMAAVMWLITRSPYALAFAALGPIGAVISLVEARRGGGRESKAARAERAAELDLLRERIDAAHDDERRMLERRAPGTAAALASVAGAALWKASGDPVVRLGTGVVRSALALSGDAREVDEQELQRRAGRLEAAPVLASPGEGVAVCGHPVLARAYARALLVQLYAAHPPGALGAPDVADPAGYALGEWDWLAGLPHADAPATAAAAVRIGLFPEARAVPPGYRALVTVTAPGTARVEQYGAEAPLEASVVPELVSREQAERFAAELGRRAAGLGLGAAARSLPTEVSFADLPPAGGRGLAANLGRTLRGVHGVDLVTDGPHAVVAGVTGSGKSELLVTWVAGMVAGRGVDEVVVLLVDFKGGTAFRPLERLPHCVGVITDLAHGEAARALSSLAAELRHREAELARLGVRDVAEARGALPRLVIVVDEFAAMIDAFPDFGPLFIDIAARGRALGVHLILATQRPAGVMRDALVANCPLRLSLRVQSAADSRWVVGSDSASLISASTPGRCVIAIDGAETAVQIARTDDADIAALVDAAAAGPAPRRPWLDPLPPVLTRAQLPAAGPEVIGLVDLPDEQRQDAVRFALSETPLVVSGAARSGKSSLLRLIARASGLETVQVGAERESAWDAVEAAAERCDAPFGAEARVLLAIDDADAVVARLGDDYAAVWCERLARVLRDGPAAGVHAVVSVQRASGALRSVLELARETVLLRQATRQDHLLAGAPAELFDEAMPAGGGVWRGRRVQFLAPELRLESAPPAAEPPHEVPLVPGPGEMSVVVTRSPARVISRARALGLPAERIVDLCRPPLPGEPVPESLLADTVQGLLLVGDPDAWLGRWGLLAALRPRHPLVFVGCDASDVRAVARSRVLPPPLAPGSGACWLVAPDGRTRRCTLQAA